VTSDGTTRQRILDAALDAFGTRGYEAVSLDDIAGAVGVTKQTLLYWFSSKTVLFRHVVEAAADTLVRVAENASRRPGPGFVGIESVVKAVFRPAVRRPALLGVIRETNRLGPEGADVIAGRMRPMVIRATKWLSKEMANARLRPADPAMTLSLVYATVVGVATEPEALRAVGWTADPAGLRTLRRELLNFLRCALEPRPPAGG
jgi:TetR/AcrR family transcriptional regulator